jgi:teichuronic acid biosynthesis glycosyltransferase TuaH
MLKKHDIIISSLFRTDNPYLSAPLCFAKELAKTHRVFYINHPYSVKDLWTGRKNEKLRERSPSLLRGKPHFETVEGMPENFIAATPPLTLPINFLPEGKLHETFHTYNQKQIEKTVRQIKDDFQVKDFIYFSCFDPFFLPVSPKKLGAFLNIYQSVDDISTESYIAKHGVRLENEAVKNADLTLVTSSNLWRKLKDIQPETYIMHNAVDLSIFQNIPFGSFEKPAEIKHIESKIIGFVGNLDPVRLDYALLRKIAEVHTDKTLLLIGPINSPEVYTQGLDKMPNVILTGGKNINDIPHYLKYMDVCILPSLLNKMSKSVYPMKINEYLAGGKAIIATNFSEDIRSFSEHIHIARDHDDFIRLIDIAVDDYSNEKIEKRVLVASKNTWGDRVNEFWNIIDKHLEKTTSTSIAKLIAKHA